MGGRGVVDPWERQSRESSQAFEAFTVYRDLGPARSVTKAAQRLHKSRSLVGRWSRAYSWVMRAGAFDREQDRVFLAEQRQARRDIARRHAKVAQAFLGKAIGRLQSLDPRDLSPSDLLRFFQVAAEVERRAAGEEPVILGDAAGEEGSFVGELSDEDRRSRMEQLRRELDRRLGEGGE